MKSHLRVMLQNPTNEIEAHDIQATAAVQSLANINVRHNGAAQPHKKFLPQESKVGKLFLTSISVHFLHFQMFALLLFLLFQPRQSQDLVVNDERNQINELNKRQHTGTQHQAQLPTNIPYEGVSCDQLFYLIWLYGKGNLIEILFYSTKKRQHYFDILKTFFIRHPSEYKTSDSDREINRNIYPDAVTRDWIRETLFFKLYL